MLRLDLEYKPEEGLRYDGKMYTMLCLLPAGGLGPGQDPYSLCLHAGKIATLPHLPWELIQRQQGWGYTWYTQGEPCQYPSGTCSPELDKRGSESAWILVPRHIALGFCFLRMSFYSTGDNINSIAKFSTR